MRKVLNILAGMAWLLFDGAAQKIGIR